ncbi:hypothetical protein NOC27_2991 [Nitrosococcus oceani AFC27]|nr:hypothetical protein NOC27_2991 [Nitrosococcus oceani AFC27]
MRARRACPFNFGLYFTAYLGILVNLRTNANRYHYFSLINIH